MCHAWNHEQPIEFLKALYSAHVLCNAFVVLGIVGGLQRRVVPAVVLDQFDLPLLERREVGFNRVAEYSDLVVCERYVAVEIERAVIPALIFKYEIGKVGVSNRLGIG